MNKRLDKNFTLTGKIFRETNCLNKIFDLTKYFIGDSNFIILPLCDHIPNPTELFLKINSKALFIGIVQN